ncbi:DUF1295 domain-containing protein [bacterium]|nr:DUF1295 domain-containing protein [bacterium]MDB4745569.1 DUF1295 domain-containing protein [Verrucomicrobiota bacterium]
MIEMLFIQGLALVTACLLMVGVFWLARRWNNYGVVDIAWAWGFILMALIYVVMTEGYSVRKLLITFPVLAWSFRLGWHLFIRVKTEHPVEDGRYQSLRNEWGDRVLPRMFWFYQLQALLLPVLSIPFLLIMRNPTPEIAFVEWFGAGIILLAVAGESLADIQLKRFRSRADNRSKVCTQGLWGYSRHPNYFFEWLVWIGFLAFALGSSYGWLSVYCPLLMLWFLLRVTGIPTTEEQALRTKGEAYARYQRTTSAFVPWFRSDDS